MNIDSEVFKHAARSIYYFEFPAGILVLMGCFVFGVGTVKGDVSLSNKHLLLGLFLFSLGAIWGGLRQFLRMAYANLKHGEGFGGFRGWPWWNLLVALMFVYPCRWSGQQLWRLISAQ
jgi:hypothetical protein